MRLHLVVEVPESATPPKVKERLVVVAYHRRGVTLTTPEGFSADVDLINVRQVD